VPDLNNVKSMKCGKFNVSRGVGLDYNTVLKQDGTVWSWGYNGYGQLGNSTTTNSNKPVQVFEMTAVKEVYCQTVSVIAVKEDGTVWSWGYNANGELGDGTGQNSNRPVKVMLPVVASPKISLKAESNDTQIKLSWNAVSGAKNYTIKKSTTDGAIKLLADSVTETTYTDAEVSKGINYRYIVTAVNDNGETIASNEATGILAGTNPELIVNSKDNLKLGEEFTADIVLNNAVNICAEDLKITYDATLFKYTGAEEIPGLKIYKEVNQGIGTLRFIIASKGKQYAVNGQNALVRLKFEAIKPGKGLIDVEKGRIADNGTVEMDVASENCGEKTVTVLGTSDVNRSGEFTLLDLAIDAWYFGDDAADTDSSKYDADVVTDGVIDDADLSAIVEQMMNNSNYLLN
jgi:YD repeat-containing protein